MTYTFIRFTLPNGDYAQWRHHGDDMPALVTWHTAADGVQLDIVNETSAEAIARLTAAYPAGRVHELTADQPHAAHVRAPAAPPVAVEFIARRAPIGHPQRRGNRVQVYRVAEQGHGIEVLQYIEQLDYDTTTAENALSAAGYTLAGVWRPEADPGTIERLPLRCDTRGFLRRMHRLYSAPGAGHATDPAAATVVREILGALLLADPRADDPARFHAALRDHLTATRDRAAFAAGRGPGAAQALTRAADILARVARTLETDFAPIS
ncbi:hypothetical protein [Nocardia carnea]|uniref:hypothetical protein n=1 Tax=Nocardia carnea TaxID=37328 RepID=UPI0002EE12B5|nr:hypothetical protein [Nocardia carnea]